jgi:pimeloyl-ACP methyl ester carboxylesterase
MLVDAGLLNLLTIRAEPPVSFKGVSERGHRFVKGDRFQTFAVLYPGRVATLTSLLSTTGDRRAMLAKPAAIGALIKARPKNRDEAIERQLEFVRIAGSTAFAIDLDRIRARAGEAYDRCFYPRGFVRQMAAILATGSRSRALRSVQAPTLVLHGTVDPLIPPAGGRATARAVPGARLRMIEGMGHDLPDGAWSILIDEIAGHAAQRAATCAPDATPRSATA